eukprot:COSAG01_NODE_4658_length_4843_cov_1.655143_2_plen_310_part_00
MQVEDGARHLLRSDSRSQLALQSFAAVNVDSVHFGLLSTRGTFLTVTSGQVVMADVLTPDAQLTLADHGRGVGCGPGSFRGEFFNNAELAGDPVAVTCSTAIDHHWSSTGGGVPELNGQIRHFSVRWTGSIQFPAPSVSGGSSPSGSWEFETTADDGSRLFVDGQLVLDKWNGACCSTWTSQTQHLSTGHPHNIVFEMQNYNGAANAILDWGFVGCGEHHETGHYLAEYWPNSAMEGQPVTLCEGAPDAAGIHKDWGAGAATSTELQLYTQMGSPPSFSVRNSCFRVDFASLRNNFHACSGPVECLHCI